MPISNSKQTIRRQRKCSCRRWAKDGQVSLLIVLLLLCLVTRGRATEPSPCDWQRWEPAIASFIARDKAQFPPRHAVLFIGSSSIRFWDLAKYFPRLVTINRGFGGSQICDSSHFLDTLVLKHRPRVVVLYAGDNDIAAGKGPEQVFHDYLAFVGAVHAALPKTQVVFIAIKPSIARWKMAPAMRRTNALVAAECAKRPWLEFVDVWRPMLAADGRPQRELFRADGLHLSHSGYTLWSRLVLPYLTKSDFQRAGAAGREPADPDLTVKGAAKTGPAETAPAKP